jgi:dihydrofolate synthase/folylpolyglutamate synthase
MARSLSDWLAYIERQHPKSIALGLDRVRAVAEQHGAGRARRAFDPRRRHERQGQTVAFLEAIARASGLRVGTYTSPHLLRYNERVRIDGHEAEDAPLVDAFEAVDAARGDTPLTYFEYGTLAALWLFERERLDLAILEVGLGGRLDAVNIVDADVAVITTVDLDHQDWLGNDRETIGKEKAGIARAWKPLVLGDDDPPSSVLGHAYRIGASAVRANCDFFFEPAMPASWRWREVNYAVDLPMPALAAPVQLRNAATAIAALRALDIPMTREAIAEGIRSAHVPGRAAALRARGRRDPRRRRPQPAGGARAGRMARPRARAVAPSRSYAALGDKDVAAWWRPSRRASMRGSSPASRTQARAARPSTTSPSGCATRPPQAAPAMRPSRGPASRTRGARPGDRVLVIRLFLHRRRGDHRLGFRSR